MGSSLRGSPFFKEELPADIVKEIKSEMLELQDNGKKAGEIIERLGDPKELAKAYLGDLISDSNSLGSNRVLAICAYYDLASFPVYL